MYAGSKEYEGAGKSRENGPFLTKQIGTIPQLTAWPLLRLRTARKLTFPALPPLRPHQPAAEDHNMRILHFLTPQRAVDYPFGQQGYLCRCMRRFVRPPAVVLPKGNLIIRR